MKKIISVFLCVLLLSGIGTVYLNAAMSEDNLSLSQTFKLDDTYKTGDANSDGNVNAADALIIKKYTTGACPITVLSRDGADMNADGKVTSRDVYYLKACFAGAAVIGSFEGNTPVYSFKIAGVDISEFVIVLPENTTFDDSVYRAFELLSEYTNKACGVMLEKEYATTPDHGIYFHVFDLDSEMGRELGMEGYFYEVRDGSLHIYGSRYRGNIYAVYEILEDTLGFYFCDDYYTYEYQKRFAGFDEGFSRKYVPAFSFRCGVGHLWGSTVSYHAYARRLNATQIGEKTNSSYYGTFTGPLFHNAHSYYYYEAMGAGVMPEDDGVTPLADRYYQKYEDGFANGVSYGLVPEESRLYGDGPDSSQPCATDAAEFENVYEGLLCTVRMVIARGYDTNFDEGVSYFSFSINDSTADLAGYCDCRICKAKANGDTVRVTGSIEDKLRDYGGEYSVDGKNVSFKKESYSGLYIDFANRAAKRIKEEFPGIKLYLILYDHTVPETVRPVDNLVLMYCGNGCNQHPLGYGGCIDGSGSMKYGNDYPAASGKYFSNIYDEYAIPEWTEICHSAGTLLYFWYYPESYSTYLYDVPDYFNMYYNIKWLRETGVDGVYFEGSSNGNAYLTEFLEFEMGLEMEWDPDITFEEYCLRMKKFIKAYYGKGYEEIYEYIVMLTEASDTQDNCYYGAFDRLWDMYSKSYIDEHYEEMHALIEEALRKERNGRVERLWASCEFMGLSAAYERMYTNGDERSRVLYEERYTSLHTWLTENGIRIYTGDIYKVPAELDFSSDPATQFFKINSRKGRG